MMNRYGEHGFDIDLYEGYETFPKKYWPLKNDLHSDQWSAIRYMISGYDENISSLRICIKMLYRIVGMHMGSLR